MSPPKTRTPAPPTARTPSNLGIKTTNIPSPQRSVSGSSNHSPLKGTTPCFHTTRPQFISSHIERCEACRLKYARQAEQATVPYSPLGMRRSSFAPTGQQRSRSRQSLGVGSTARPASAAAIAPPGSSAATMTGLGINNNGGSLRPSSRASIASRASENRRASQPLHRRSSSTGSPTMGGKSAGMRRTSNNTIHAAQAVLALATENGEIPPPPHMASLSAVPMAVPPSPTDGVSMRSRTRVARNSSMTGSRQVGANGGRESRRSSLTPRDQRSGSRRAGNESPSGFTRGSPRTLGSMSQFPDSSDEKPEIAIDNNVLMETIVDQKRAMDKKFRTVKEENAQLKEEITRLRLAAATATPEAAANPQPGSGSEGSDNIFSFSESKLTKQRANEERALERDRAALDMFEEYRRAYEECEPSLRSNRVQFAGERPLSPPPARYWGGGGIASGPTKTPIRGMDVSENDTQRATLTAEVRRAGEDLMSTPVRHNTPRRIRANSIRRTGGKSRPGRPLFSGDSDRSDDDDDDGDTANGDDARDELRKCLTAASSFGKFLVRYVNRQVLDNSAIHDEYNMLLNRFNELEKRTAQLDKQNKRLEDSRAEYVAQSYEASAERESLKDVIDSTERTNKRLTNENDKLKQDLSLSNERGQQLDEQIVKLNASMDKSRQRYEQELASLRRNTNSLQTEKGVLVKKNEELRVELKGKLQRAGLKANIDEYMAERKRAGSIVADSKSEAGASATDVASGAQNDGVTPEQSIRRLQESVLYYRKKYDHMSRKLHKEKINHKEANRMLRLQQEETYRFQQMYGPLPDDMAVDAMESLGSYLPGMTGERRASNVSMPKSPMRSSSLGVAIASDIDSDSMSDKISNKSVEDLTAALSSAVAAEGVGSFANLDHEFKFAEAATGAEGLSSGGESENNEDADARDIQLYQQRMNMRNRRSQMTTPRKRRGTDARRKTASNAASVRQSVASTSPTEFPSEFPSAMPAGESLGDILGGASTMWDEPAPAEKRSPKTPKDAVAPLSLSLASELGGFGDISRSLDSPSRLSSAALGSPSRKMTRAGRSRTSTLPFADEDKGFGMGFSASVSLAEQFAASARSKTDDKPKMVDASTSTDPLPEFANAQTSTLATVGSSADSSVQATLPLPSTDVSVGTANVGPDAVRSIGVESATTMASLVDGAIQTEAAATKELGTQAGSATAHQQSATDPAFGVEHRAVGTAVAVANGSAQVQPDVVSAGMVTDMSSSMVGEQSVEAIATANLRGVQASAEISAASVVTDPLFGVSHASTSVDIAVQENSCQAVAELAELGMATDRLFGTTSQTVEALPESAEIGIATDRLFGTASQSVEAIAASTNTGMTTDRLFGTSSQSIDVVAPLSDAGMATDRLFGTASQSVEVVAEVADCSVATDRLFGTASQSVEAIAESQERGVSVGAGSSCDASTETSSPPLHDRGVVTVAPQSNDMSVATETLSTSDTQVATDDAMLLAWLEPLIPAGITMATVFAALSRRGEPVHELHARKVEEATRSAAEAEQARAAEAAAATAAATAKTYVDRGTSPDVNTSEQSVQVEPKTESKGQQVGPLSTTEAGVDAPSGPVLITTGVGTECKLVDRWTDPSDPVEKRSQSIEAVVATVDHSTSNETTWANASAGTDVVVAEVSVSAVAQLVEHATDMDISVKHAGVGPVVELKESATAMAISAKDAGVGPTAELKESAVAAGVSETRDFGTSAVAEVAERFDGPLCEMAEQSIDSTMQLSDKQIDACTAQLTSRGVGADFAFEMADKAAGPAQTTAERGVDPEVDGMRADVCVGQDETGYAHVAVAAGSGAVSEATVATHDGVVSAERSIGTECAMGSSSDAGVQAEPVLIDAHVGSAAPSTTSVAVETTFVSNRAIRTDNAAVGTTAEALVATSPVTEVFVHADAVPKRQPRTVEHKSIETEAKPSVAGKSVAVAAVAATADAFAHTAANDTVSTGVATDADDHTRVDNFEHVAYPGSSNASSDNSPHMLQMEAIESMDSILSTDDAFTAPSKAGIKTPDMFTANDSYDERGTEDEHDGEYKDAEQSSPALRQAGGLQSDLSTVEEMSPSGHSQLSLPRLELQQPKPNFDKEDYGYILVRPRNYMQGAQMSGIDSTDSLPESPTQRKSLALARGDSDLDEGAANDRRIEDMFKTLSPRRVTSAGVLETVDESEDQDAMELGRDLEEEEDGELDDGSDVSDVDAENLPAVSSGHQAAEMQTGSSAPAAAASAAVGKRASCNVAIETSPEPSYISRQPEPLIVQSIARTMVGTYMWKYTSTRFKATGSHERRHMRYFWILPYAKTLYWGKEPMSTSMTLSRSARVSGSRSVYMRDIRIVPDQHDSGSHDEPQYCIIVTTNHREVKIKATSQADHDMWYMAMAYLQNRRIITSTTYPSNTFVNDLSEYPSDTSAHSMATSMGSGTALPLHQRLLNRAESRGILSRNQARHTMAAPAPVAGGSRSAPRPHSEMPPSHPGTTPGQQGATMFSQGSYASQLSNQESMASSNISGGHPRQRHGSPSMSLQSTPKALRPVSVVAPTSGSGNEGKRISIGLFRRDGTGSGLLRNGSQQSDGSYVSIGGGSPSALRPADSRSMQQPQSIAAAISTTTLHHRENSSSSASRTVRKMFSGSILRVLRSREHEDSGNGPV